MQESTIQDSHGGSNALLDVSLTCFYRSGTLSSSASVLPKNKDDASTPSPPSHYHDFLKFLAICQIRDIDFLGITWDRVLDDNSDLIGLGLTSEIRPGTLNLDVSFAFKRLTDSNYAQAAIASGQERRHRAYEALISEISVLGHPTIQDHENIIRLEGVCWDFLPGDQEEKVRPVLVFEKAKHGDLGRFMKSKHGQELTWDRKLKLCSDIITGIAIMHSCGIVHGDIKPHNILIFEQQDSVAHAKKYVAKVADFGYSTYSQSFKDEPESECIILPWSPPWNAPEVNADNYILSPSKAQLSDVFSLGVTCLWVLFMKEASENPGDGSKRDQDWLNTLKINGTLKPFAHEMINGLEHLSGLQKQALQKFFELAISLEPEKRCTNLYQLLALLNLSEEISEIPPLPVDLDVAREISSAELLFQFPRNVAQFAATDFRLRKYIVTCLQHESLACVEQGCKENAAFQLAFSYKTGFACKKDDSAAQKAVTDSAKSMDDLTLAIALALPVHQPYRNQNVAKLILEGYVHVIDYANMYRNLGLLEESEIHYKREIQDMEVEFPNEDIIFDLKIILSDILIAQGKYDDAEILLKGIIERAETDDAFRNLFSGDLGTSLTRLATIYENKGLYGEAVEVFHDSLKRLEERVGKHHPQTLATSLNLASVLQQLGQAEAAETIIRDCLFHYELVQGSDHPNTITVLGNLATLLFEQGRSEEALEVLQKVVISNERWFGPEHHDTLISLNNLARIQTHLKKFDRAEETSRLVWEKMSECLGPDHAHTITSFGTYGMTLFAQEKYRAAEHIFRKVLDDMRRIRGKIHNDVLKSMSNLAMVLLKQGKFEEAQQVVQTILDEREPRPIGNLETLRPFRWLGVIFLKEGFHDIAEQLLRLAIEGGETMSGEGARLGVFNSNTLVYLLLEQERFVEAEVFSRAALKRCTDHPDDESVSLGLNNNLAVALEAQGKFEEAVEIHRQSLESHARLLGNLHPGTLTCMSNLGTALSGQKMYPEAEELLLKAMHGYRDVLGSEHLDYLSSTNNLATCIAIQGRLNEAADLYKTNLESLTKLYGSEHVATQKCARSLNIVLSRMEEAKSKE